MKPSLRLIICVLTLGFAHSISALAWGRHDLITQVALNAPELAPLKEVKILPEPIEKAAPDLLQKVIPGLEAWCRRYHMDHDSRYRWTTPTRADLERFLRAQGREPTDREALLWALEDNFDTPLETGRERTAAEILVRYVAEPDGMLDGGLNRPPYIQRMRASMSYFYQGRDQPHTHAFRHYYVTSSLVPPILSPKGIAPYRADLYARLSAGAFKTGHPYWGYRFLAWSLHYVQDVTQPWHTVFVPGLSFVRFSKADMKHDISALHFLTEAFADSWMLRVLGMNPAACELESPPGRGLAPVSDTLLSAAVKVSQSQMDDPWFVSRLAERLAREAHARSGEIAELARSFFDPIVRELGADLEPDLPTIALGGIGFASAKLDFNGDGSGATEFLAPLWSPRFGLPRERDRLLAEVITQVNAAIEGSRLVVASVIQGITPRPSRLSSGF